MHSKQFWTMLTGLFQLYGIKMKHWKLSTMLHHFETFEKLRPFLEFQLLHLTSLNHLFNNCKLVNWFHFSISKQFWTWTKLNNYGSQWKKKNPFRRNFLVQVQWLQCKKVSKFQISESYSTSDIFNKFEFWSNPSDFEGQ